MWFLWFYMFVKVRWDIFELWFIIYVDLSKKDYEIR